MSKINKYYWKVLGLSVLMTIFGMGKIKAQDKNVRNRVNPSILENTIGAFNTTAKDGMNAQGKFNIVVNADGGISSVDNEYHAYDISTGRDEDGFYPPVETAKSTDKQNRGTAKITTGADIELKYDENARAGARVIAEFDFQNQSIANSRGQYLDRPEAKFDPRLIDFYFEFMLKNNGRIGTSMGNASPMGDAQFLFNLPAGADNLIRHREGMGVKAYYANTFQDRDCALAYRFYADFREPSYGRYFSDNTIIKNHSSAPVAIGAGGEVDCKMDLGGAAVRYVAALGYSYITNGMYDEIGNSVHAAPQIALFADAEFKKFGISGAMNMFGTFNNLISKFVAESYYKIDKNSRVSLFAAFGWNPIMMSEKEGNTNLADKWIDNKYTFVGAKYQNRGICAFITFYYIDRFDSFGGLNRMPIDDRISNGKSLNVGVSLNLAEILQRKK
ncbi:MAG: hypothetical protein LBK26_02135 [Rickettsiales bacterium]|jgi:hypothetical protein|nr:hypothetical protein [Rickettsiales bacterium]